MLYDNLRDARQYLEGTVAYWEGDPVYVGGVEQGAGKSLSAFVYRLPYRATDAFHVDISDERFNCFKYKLGYVNKADGEVFYVSRRPSRGVAQGICGNNLSIRNIDGQDQGRIRDEFVRLIKDTGFRDALMGKYPTVAEAREQLVANPKLRAVAFNKYFCLKRHPNFTNLFFLGYKGEEIAFSATQEFTLPTELSYLKEVCTPSGIVKAA